MYGTSLAPFAGDRDKNTHLYGVIRGLLIVKKLIEKNTNLNNKETVKFAVGRIRKDLLSFVKLKVTK